MAGAVAVPGPGGSGQAAVTLGRARAQVPVPTWTWPPPAPPHPRPRPRVTWKGREANPQIPAAGFAREAGPGVREARCAAGREGGLGPPTPCPRGGFLLYHVWGRVQCFTNRVNNQSREVRGLQSHQAPHVTDRGSARDGRGAHSLKGHLPVAVPLVAVEPALVHLPVLVHQTPVS